jgi:hypothetical protein
MGYLGTKPANSPLTSELIPDGMIGTSDLANGAVTQDKLSTLIAPKGTPAFAAHITTASTLAHNVSTKIPFGTELFDTNSNYDTANYRFTPTIAGYYQVNLATNFNVTNSRVYYIATDITRSGTIVRRGVLSTASSGAGTELALNSTALVYMNGTTDYLEAYMYQYDYTASSTISYSNTQLVSHFSASLVRAA